MKKRIGILIYSGANLFINGIVQNAYFLLRCFQRCGYECDLLCQGKDPKPFEHGGLILKSITEDTFDFKQYQCIITGCAFLSMSEYNKCNELGIQTVDFTCGNHYMTDIQLFINGAGEKSTFHGSEKTASVGWTIPSYAFTLAYMETIRRYPIHIVPHLWSPELLIERARRYHNISKEKLYYCMKRRVKMNLIILEPNLNVQKAAVLPLVAAEWLWKRQPELINSVIVSNVRHDVSKKFIKDLTVPVTIIPRTSIEKILIEYNTVDAMPVFVCNQMLNTLNYLYYELLYFGYPLIHNSPDIGDCGYKYDTIESCAEQIVKAYTIHSKTYTSYLETAHAYLEQINPENPDVGATFVQKLDQ